MVSTRLIESLRLEESQVAAMRKDVTAEYQR